MEDLKGQIFLITGATSGVGRGIALGLARRGADLFLAARDEAGLLALATRLAHGYPQQKFAYEGVDLSLPQGRRTLAEEARQVCPHLNGAVLCAGGLHWNRRTNPQGIELTWALNFLGAAALFPHLKPLLEKAPQRPRIALVTGSQLTLGTLEKRLGDPKRPYNPFSALNEAAQAKLLWAQEAALRWPAGDVVTFHPGFVKTSLTKSLPGPLKFLGSLASHFLSEECPEGTWAAADPSLTGHSGVFVETYKIRHGFPFWSTQALRDRVWRLAEDAL